MNANRADASTDLFSENAADYAGSAESAMSVPGLKAIISRESEIIAHIREHGIRPDPKMRVRIGAYLLSLAYANNKILSLSNSRTRILAHQVESTHRIVNALNQRFLIADEVGLGKTIEAGLVIKELVFRYRYKRILIVCPASLLVQWQSEMEEKFAERFDIVDRRTIDRIRRFSGEGENPWAKIEKGICSIDFIKSESVLADIGHVKWDAVIIDEAHRLRRDAQVSTQAYHAGEILSAGSRAFLLLTATPFRGKLEELYYLVRLADRNLLGPFQSFQNEYCAPDADLARLREKLSAVVIRRTKKEVGGFTRRFARTIRFEFYPEERALYEATTRYVAEEFNRALATENRAIGFVMTVFQKLLDSSAYALLSALRNRRAHLNALLEKTEVKIDNRNDEGGGDDGYAEMTPLDPEYDEYEEYENEKACDTARKTAYEIREEITTIDELIRLAESVTRTKKGEKLLEMIKTLREKGYSKFLIFTQFRTTQDYLAGLLSAYEISVFNGSMNKDEKEDAIHRFQNVAEILICTEAGGEGRNMQFCPVLFNYDLPWSPLKIEQRIGRIHRFGQKRDVAIYNFSTKDTVAERVLDVITRKLRLFEDSIGTPDIMLGQIEDEVRLSTLFMELSTGRRSRQSVEEEIDRSIATARASFEKLAGLTVARRMDFNYDEYYRITQKDRAYSNKQLSQFIGQARRCTGEIDKYLGSQNGKTGLFPVRALPDGGRHHGYGTFESEKALSRSDIDFLAFGHPLVDHVIAHCQSAEFGGVTGVMEMEHDRSFNGMIFHYIATYVSVTETREVIPVVVDFDGTTFSSEIERIERECARNSTTDFVDAIDMVDASEYEAVVEHARKSIDGCAARARERLREKIEHKLWDIRENLDLTIDPEIDKIRESYARQIREFEDQLDRQELQMKCAGREMRGAISRTRNRMAEAIRERDAALAVYRRRLGIRCDVELLCAGVIIAKNPISQSR